MSKIANKSFITNSTALLISIVGHSSVLDNQMIFHTGIFALSGAATNWIAIYMLFEKVPYLYGSGVIPSQFEEFKFGIKKLIMGQFFTAENVSNFFSSQTQKQPIKFDLSPVLDKINYDQMFDKLVAAVLTSPLGAMLGMMGGAQALEPVKEPFIAKMRDSFLELSQEEPVQTAISDSLKQHLDSEKIVSKVEQIVQKRLDELTPQLVKEIIQDMIEKHLGWLVVWGGVFGGLIGLIAGYLQI